MLETKVICGLESGNMTWVEACSTALPALAAYLTPQPGTRLSSTTHLSVAAATHAWRNQSRQGVLAGRPLSCSHLIGISRLPYPS